MPRKMMKVGACLLSEVFIAYMLVKPAKGRSMRRQEMIDARTAVEDVLGGKTSCDMLIEGIAFDRGPIGEVTTRYAQYR